MACTKDSKLGSPDKCNVSCANTPIAQPINSDGCCPEGADAVNDNDCKPSCGNGVTEPPEICDGTSCPTQSDCDNRNNGCMKYKLMGGACSAMCVAVMVTTPSGTTADSCCPPGANKNTDTDCKAVCGNNVKEAPEETCDGSDCPTADDCPDDGMSCTKAVVTGDRCKRVCVQQPITQASGRTADGCCIGNRRSADIDCPAMCGNGETEEPEETCDGRDCPTPATCATGSDPCVTYTVEGTACAQRCVPHKITTVSRTADGCCPAGANVTTDVDCTPKCGDQHVDAGEECDNVPEWSGKCTANCKRSIYKSCTPNPNGGITACPDQSGICLVFGYCAPSCPSGAPDSCPSFPGASLMCDPLRTCALSCQGTASCPPNWTCDANSRLCKPNG